MFQLGVLQGSLYLSDMGQVYLGLVIIDKTLVECGLLVIYNILAFGICEVIAC